MVENFCMVLFSFFFFSFSSVLFAAIFFFFVTVDFCFLFIKHLRSRTQTQYKQRPPTPTPGPQPGWLFCGCFPGVWHRWAGAGSWGGGICTAVPWGDGHKKGYLNKITTKSRAPTKTADDAHEGAWDTVKRQMGPGWPWLSLEALWGERQAGLAFRL